MIFVILVLGIYAGIREYQELVINTYGYRAPYPRYAPARNPFA